MPDERYKNRRDDSPEVLIVSPPDYSYEDIKSISDDKKKSGGLGNIVDNILDRVKGILSRFLGREVKNDDLLLLGLILLLFLRKGTKKRKQWWWSWNTVNGTIVSLPVLSC